MTKAFDNIYWDFLLQIMMNFGFQEHWLKWIFSLIKEPHFSILINEELRGYFRSTRGLQQGDPLSPYLFIILTKILGRGMNHLYVANKIHGLHISSNAPPITHSQFTDDTLLAISLIKHEIKHLLNFLQVYKLTLGQAINRKK